MILTTKEATSYFQPWPIRLPSRSRWDVQLIRFSKSLCLRLWSCWKDDKRRRVNIYRTYEKVICHNYGQQRHQVRSMARHPSTQDKPFFITLDRKFPDGMSRLVVYDGNHTLMALLHAHYDGLIMWVRGVPPL